MTTRASSEPASTVVDAVVTRVGAVIDPELRRSLAELGMVGDVTVAGDEATIELRLTVAGCPHVDLLTQAAYEAAVDGTTITRATVTTTTMSDEERRALVARLRPAGRVSPFTAESSTRVIAVTSGKGGVGKSSVTVNLACAWAKRGLRVGIIDADVYGYSVPALMGLAPGGIPVRPVRLDDAIVPPVGHHVKVMSIGMFVDDTGVAVAWRGPMLQRTVSQFLTDVYFGDLDILLIDLPPGTGDVAITVGQLVPHSDVVIVTTPQPYAAGVAIRAGGLAAATGQRVIGVIENMAGGLDDSTAPLFGAGGADAVVSGLAERGVTTRVLGRIPLSAALAASADTGVPLVVADDSDAAASVISEIANAVLDASNTGRRGLGVTPRSE